MKNNWKCSICYKEFKTKKELVAHLSGEFDEYSMMADMAVEQLEDLGVKNPYQ
jgi:hypothetical protein